MIGPTSTDAMQRNHVIPRSLLDDSTVMKRVDSVFTVGASAWQNSHLRAMVTFAQLNPPARIQIVAIALLAATSTSTVCWLGFGGSISGWGVIWRVVVAISTSVAARMPQKVMTAWSGSSSVRWFR